MVNLRTARARVQGVLKSAGAIRRKVFPGRRRLNCRTKTPGRIMALAFNGNLATRYFVCNVIIRLSSWRFENASSREFSNPADRSDDRCVPTTLVREISDKGPLPFHGFHISKVILLCLPFFANRRTFRKKKERETRNDSRIVYFETIIGKETNTRNGYKTQIDRINDSLIVSFTPRRDNTNYLSVRHVHLNNNFLSNPRSRMISVGRFSCDSIRDCLFAPLWG